MTLVRSWQQQIDFDALHWFRGAKATVSRKHQQEAHKESNNRYTFLFSSAAVAAAVCRIITLSLLASSHLYSHCQIHQVFHQPLTELTAAAAVVENENANRRKRFLLCLPQEKSEAFFFLLDLKEISVSNLWMLSISFRLLRPLPMNSMQCQQLSRLSRI